MPEGRFYIWAGFDEKDYSSFVGIGIRLTDGNLLDGFACSEHEPDYERTRRLYDAARRSAYHVGERLYDLKAMLKKLSAEAHS